MCFESIICGLHVKSLAFKGSKLVVHRHSMSIFEHHCNESESRSASHKSYLFELDMLSGMTVYNHNIQCHDSANCKKDMK